MTEKKQKFKEIMEMLKKYDDCQLKIDGNINAINCLEKNKNCKEIRCYNKNSDMVTINGLTAEFIYKQTIDLLYKENKKLQKEMDSMEI